MRFSKVWKIIFCLGVFLASLTLQAEVYHIPPSDFSSKMIVAGCFCENDGKLLLLLRNPERTCGNTWCLPAGRISLSESPITACMRQVKKETGIQLVQEDLSLFKKFYVRLPDKDFELYLFEVKLSSLPKVALNSKENSAYKWVTLSEAFTLPLIPGADVYMKLRAEKKSN